MSSKQPTLKRPHDQMTPTMQGGCRIDKGGSSVPRPLRFSSRELCEFQLRVMYPKVPCNSVDQIEIKVLPC